MTSRERFAISAGREQRSYVTGSEHRTMVSVLHPCRSCGHRTMDECWSAGQRLLHRDRGLCLDCHDECVTKAHEPSTGAPAKERGRTARPELFF